MASLGLVLKRRGLPVRLLRREEPVGESLGILAEAQHLAFLSNKVPPMAEDVLVFGAQRFRVLAVAPVMQGKEADHVEHYEVRIERLSEA